MKTLVTIFALLFLFVPGMVVADHKHHRHDCHTRKHDKKVEHHLRKAREHLRSANRLEPNAYHGRGDDRLYGKVLSVEPVHSRRYDRGHDSCVTYSDGFRTQQSWTPAVLGGLVGGAVGYGLGGDHGDPEVATIAGGLLGATVGRDLGRRIYESRHLEVRGPCVARHHSSRPSQPVEYMVTYRYNGRVYQERMDHHPGEWVALDVEVSPA